MQKLLKKIVFASLSATLLISGIVGCSEEVNSSSLTVDRLLSALCSAAQRCDSRLKSSECVDALNGDIGKQLWDEFGLQPPNTYPTTQVRQEIDSKVIRVSSVELDSCLQELNDTCSRPGEAIPVGSYANVENLINDRGACPRVLSRN